MRDLFLYLLLALTSLISRPILAAPQPPSEALLVPRDDTPTSIPFPGGTLLLTNLKPLPLADPTACIKALSDANAMLTTTLWNAMASSHCNPASGQYNMATPQITAWNGCGVLFNGPSGPDDTDTGGLRIVDIVQAFKYLGDWMYIQGNMGKGGDVAVKINGAEKVDLARVKSIPGGAVAAYP